MGSRVHKEIAAILVAGMTLWPSFLPAGPPAPAEAGPKIDLDYLTPDAAAAVVTYPRRLLSNPEAELLPVEAVRLVLKEKLGIDPADIEQTLSIAEPDAEPAAGATIIHLARPLGPGKILAPLWDHTTEASFDGKSYRQAIGPMDQNIFRADDRTIVTASEVHLLERMLRHHAHPKAGPMTAALARVADPPDLLAIFLPGKMPGAVADVLRAASMPRSAAEKLSEMVASLETRANFTGNSSLSLTMQAANEEAAQQLEAMIDAGLILAEGSVSVEAANQGAAGDPLRRALARYAKQAGERIVQSLRPVRKGTTFTLAATGRTPQVATMGVLLALLLPAMHTSDHPQPAAPPDDAQRLAVALASILPPRGNSLSSPRSWN